MVALNTQADTRSQNDSTQITYNTYMENNEGKTALRPCIWPLGATSGMNCPKIKTCLYTNTNRRTNLQLTFIPEGRSLGRCDPHCGLYSVGCPANRSDVPQSLLRSQVEAVVLTEKNRLTVWASAHRGSPRSVFPPTHPPTHYSQSSDDNRNER